jgi:hypothetical protein
MSTLKKVPNPKRVEQSIDASPALRQIDNPNFPEQYDQDTQDRSPSGGRL